MMQRWDLLTFVHWGYEPAEVQRLLPAGLTVETYNDLAWIGLVPFTMEVRAPRGPAMPWISHFPETNVRTYVIGPDGQPGVWFFSLDAARLAAVVTARATYRLPYFWSSMRLERDGDHISYTCHRRGPTPRRVASRLRVHIGARYDPTTLTEFDHYLTARWRVYSPHRNGVRFALAEHEPWQLHRAQVLAIDDHLVAATGLPEPTSEPIAHWSPGTEVRIGFPKRALTTP